MSHCCIPGCSYQYKAKDAKWSMFKILRPDLGRKTEEEKAHYENLTKFILSLRDCLKGDKIKEMLHKEVASICEQHFENDAIVPTNSRKKLKLGVLPTKCLPKKVKEIKVS